MLGGLLRLKWIGRALQAQGYDEVVLAEDVEDESGAEFDVVVVQRPAKREMLRHIERLQAGGVTVVVDIDDDFHTIPVNNITYRDFHPKHSPHSNRDYITKACKIADLVTVSTPALALRYGAHGRVKVLRNCIPAWYLDIKAEPTGHLGWSGAIETHPDDLQVTRGAIDRTGIPFRVVGKGNGVQKALDLREEPEATGWLDINGPYQQAIASLSVGIVPLQENAFNVSKSWLKGLEYAALGVPFLASPLPEYLELNKLGAGVIAKKPRDWEHAPKYLMNDRETYSEAGRATARLWTIENRAWMWLEAWQEAKGARSQCV